MTMTTSANTEGTTFTGEVVNVLCDASGRVGALSYQVPAGLVVNPGDAVEVPFGKRQLHGMVLGPGDPKLATREIIAVHGKRATPQDLKLVQEIAKLHFSDLPTVAARLSPKSGRGAQALDAGLVVLKNTEQTLPEIPEEVTRRLYVKAPLISSAEIAALEASRLSRNGQVLILCPSVDSLTQVLSFFKSGAARLDSKAPAGAWKGFSEGEVQVGIGTRSAALYSANNLAGVVVVDEDHPGHFEATQPYTNARDVASMRTLAFGIPLTLISANPTTSGMGAKVKVFPLGSKGDWPFMRIVDREEFPPSERLLPPPLVAAVNRNLKAGLKVLVLSETRKASRRCQKCSELRPCSQCHSSLCRHQETTPCKRCGSDRVMMLGWDTERVDALFKGKVQAATAAELADFNQGPALVVMFDVDPALNIPSFHPEALGSHLILSAARAAGKEGSLMVLTRQPNHPLLVDLCARRDQVGVAKRAWLQAKEALLPPFGRLITIKVGRAKAPSTAGAPGQVHGPRKTADGWEILIRCKEEDLPKAASFVERTRRAGKVRVTLL